MGNKCMQVLQSNMVSIITQYITKKPKKLIYLLYWLSLKEEQYQPISRSCTIKAKELCGA